MTTNKKPTTVGVNYFKFSGSVKKKDFQYSKNGKPFCTISLSVPAKNEKFSNTFRLKAFGELAEQIDKDVNDGGNFAFNGYVTNSSYTNQKGDKVWSTDFIINAFETALVEAE